MMTPELAFFLQASTPRHANGRMCGHYVRFNVQKAPYAADHQWNRVSNVEPSGPKAETLPLGHRGLSMVAKSCGSSLVIVYKKTVINLYFSPYVDKFSTLGNKGWLFTVDFGVKSSKCGSLGIRS
ncbi:hypothetical protein AVEN_238763-1 [Araneus ventricosus]|uniref:Uncharacterized protein n=1 Tax=Araneus ventricosus TaxID=182803 RepID=A0A4Y2W1E7_ARAVE|nr:hypothetical protein AVEN_238763-1 [Araneus ventricosus]